MTDPSRNPMLVGRRGTLKLFAAAAVASGAGALLSEKTAFGATQFHLTQVRNATLRVDYAGVRFLIDPMFAGKGATPGFEGSANSKLRSPLVDLPLTVEQLADVDAVVVTHLHSDHWDDEAAAILDKKLPLFAQNDEDAAHIRSQGFQDVRTLTENTEFQGIHLAKTGGQHGTDATLEAIPALGQVCGVVFSHPSNKRLYLAGDTIWNEHVAAAISRHHPEIIVLNAGKAVFPGFPPIIMGEEDVLAVHKAAPEATLIASHMEAVNHCVLSRAALRAYSEEQGFASSLLVPADGETLAFK
ncbi:MBL fold metallo-hydrolase [Sinorhizobium medicae]|uniref:MBL fold metallo-hydrolase n=1 Tax=Sinorhizobium medicae TaxID=110321 RepID=UPI002AF6A326|nr:MBL fold metallo-hydrolase [Sinorhizobium medicae]WQO85199.1 MBL fold metallo-hydrolase [Sinorhizobium medicae]